jgi:hypothetical protein
MEATSGSCHLVTLSPCHRVLILAVFLYLSGCGGSAPVGEVAGKVTFKGRPVGEGRVTFQNLQTGAADEAELNNDGAYAIKSPMPVGEYKVMVSPLIVRKQVDGKGPVVGVEKAAPDIPDKYRTIGSTDLKETVKEGKNELNFDLKR